LWVAGSRRLAELRAFRVLAVLDFDAQDLADLGKRRDLHLEHRALAQLTSRERASRVDAAAARREAP
jgi:hypothetical protein